jgi:hypothetical protein
VNFYHVISSAAYSGIVAPDPTTNFIPYFFFEMMGPGARISARPLPGENRFRKGWILNAEIAIIGLLQNSILKELKSLSN